MAAIDWVSPRSVWAIAPDAHLAAVLDSQLRDIARETGELTMLAVPEFPAGMARYIATADSASRPQVTAEVGSSMPLTAGAAWKAILAFQPQERINLVLRRELPRLAEGTPTDPKVIREEVKTIRRLGWAFSWEETYDGAWAVAAPLVEADKGTAFASLGIEVPTARYSRAVERAICGIVVQGAARAVQTLGSESPNG